MQSKYGERRFLFSLYQLLDGAQRIKDDVGNEFIVLPFETVEKAKETLLMVVNRMEGPLFRDED